MKAITAHVRNGQIVPDEAIALAEGVEVEVLVREDEDDVDDMTDTEREELEAALDESREQFERGEYEDARTVVLRVMARM